MHLFDPKVYLLRVRRCVEKIMTRLGPAPTPEFCLTLGSGLADLITRMKVYMRIPYADVGLPTPVVSGHAGELIYGEIGGVPVMALSGRIHYNEVSHVPHGIMEVVFATHVMAELGIKNCFTTNAVGGLNASYRTGGLMVIEDHINQIPNPISGPHLAFEGSPHFLPMNNAYNPKLRALFMQAARKADAKVCGGVYLGLPGRTYETAAEVRAFRTWGADAVGMSTTPEIIAATSRGMETIGVSIITNVMAPDGANATNHEEVEAILKDPVLQEKLANVFESFFASYRLENPLAVT